MGYYMVTYVVEGTAETDTFSKEEFNEELNGLIENTTSYKEKKGTDFEDFRVYLTPTTKIIHETDEENSRLTIFSDQKIKVFALEGRLKNISESDFQRVGMIIKRMYGSVARKSEHPFGSYIIWENITDAAKCIIENDKFSRLTIYARDRENFKDITNRLFIN